MTWDMVLVTVTLATVFLLMILLALVSRSWPDETPRKRERDSQHGGGGASPESEIEKISGQENSLA